uniref:Histone PARylation factor 1 n=1 Tax=Buteo japonicus TaxID=224669 RepID=A0A8C0B342_9AVES
AGGAGGRHRCEKNGDVKKRRSNQADIPDSLRQEAETCYRLRLPEDFYQFWKFCEELDPEKPSGGFLNIFAFSNFRSQGQPEGRQTGRGPDAF